MTKRRNPYADSTPIQAKQHVGFKERATEEEKQAVYAKTLALLFQGANPGAKVPSSHSGVGVSNGASNGSHSFPSAASSMSASGTSNGHSLHRYFGGGGQVGRSGAREGGCCSCHSQPAGLSTCTDCEGRVCDGCVRCCSICKETFCTFCSVLNYDKPNMQVLCLNCLPTHNS